MIGRAFALYLTLAAAPALARTVEVEIAQRARDGAPVAQKLLLEVGDSHCSSVNVRGPKAPALTVKMCPTKSGYGIEVHLPDADLEAHAPGGAGQRTVVGRFERADGSTLEVATTPR